MTVARQIVGSFLLTNRDLREYPGEEDLVQECLVHWWQQRGRYSQGRGASPQTYTRRVLEKKLLDIARAERAEKRKAQKQGASLQEQNEYGLAPADTIADPDAGPEDRAEQHEVGLHIRKVLLLLSPRQQQLARALSTGATMTEISRMLKMPRPTLYDDLARIRKVFRDEGLEEYLK